MDYNARVRFCTGWLRVMALGVTVREALMAWVTSGPFRAPGISAWRALAYSLLAWFVLDTGLSLYRGVIYNAVLNGVLFAGFAIPLGALRTCFLTRHRPASRVVSSPHTEPNSEWNIDMRTTLIFGTWTRCFAIAALGFGPLMGCSGTATGPEESAQYFPLVQGNTWTYAPEVSQFGEPFEWSVVGRVGDTVTLARPAGGSHPGPVTLLDRQEAIDLLPGEGEVLPFYRFEAGASWVRRDPWECDDGASWVAVVEEDPITTPAGVFRNTIRMERRTTANCTDAGTTFEWWAPGIGLVQWEELNFYAGGPLTFQLMSYSVS